METTEISVETERYASEIEKTAFEIFNEDLSKTAKANFMRDGELYPIVFIMMKAEKDIQVAICPVAQFMDCVEGKETLSELMRQIGKAEPIAICMVTEAYISVLDGLSHDEAIARYQAMPPSKDPQRKEILLLTFESENIQRQTMYIIGREPLSLVLNESYSQKGTKYEGRFVNFLKDLKKAKYN